MSWVYRKAHLVVIGEALCKTDWADELPNAPRFGKDGFFSLDSRGFNPDECLPCSVYVNISDSKLKHQYMHCIVFV